jgi:hypothetical protein
MSLNQKLCFGVKTLFWCDWNRLQTKSSFSPTGIDSKGSYGTQGADKKNTEK